MDIEIEVTEEYLFPSMVWSAFVANAEQMNRALIDTAEDLRSTVQSVQRSNEMGWHSPTDMHKREAFKPICDCIHQMAGTIAESMSLRTDRRFVIESLWVNINPKNAYNALHNHPQSQMSGVYYVQVDELSGMLRFRDPRAAKVMNPWPVAADKRRDQRHWDRVNYKPAAGRLIMFPSWLEHDVQPNQSDQERISISFNLGLEKPAEQ